MKAKSYYKDMLINNILQFWLENGVDKVNGGIYTALDRSGNLIDTDKSIWFQGRALYIFSAAYNDIEAKKEYLDASHLIASFIDNHGFDKDSRMFFRVTKDGKPVIKRLRYFYSETFAIIGYASYAKASKQSKYLEKAYDLFKFVNTLLSSDVLIPKFDSVNRNRIGFGPYMILINTASVLRESMKENDERKSELTNYINSYIKYIENNFINYDKKIVLEQAKTNGQIDLEHFEGRLLNPGHAIEGAWFILKEGQYQNNEKHIKLGLMMLDWMYEVGWDKPYGGIIQYRDALGYPSSEYHHDMKFWWPQCEAAIATNLAYKITKDERYKNQLEEVEKYIEDKLVDKEKREWFGYLNRDGSVSTTIKGNFYKGPFHIPRYYIRMYLD